VSLAAALLAVALTAGVQSEVRGGRPSGGTDASAELQVEPSLQLREKGPDASFQAAYAPRLHLAGDGGLSLLHRLLADLTLPLGRAAQLGLVEEAQIGVQDFSPLGASVANAVTSPAGRFVEVVGASTQARLSLLPWRGLRTSATLGFQAQGGRTVQDQAQLPLTRVWLANVAADTALAGGSRVGFSAQASASTATNGARSSVAVATASLNQSLGRGASGSAGLGLGWVSNAPKGSAAAVTALSPWLDAGLHVAEAMGGERLSLDLQARLSPSIDPLSGAAYTRLDASAEAGWLTRSALRISLRTGLVRVLDGSQLGSQSAQAEGGVSLALGRGLALGAGLRAAVLDPHGTSAASSGAQWAGYLSVRGESRSTW
jgi:hypothetical protein